MQTLTLPNWSPWGSKRPTPSGSLAAMLKNTHRPLVLAFAIGMTPAVTTHAQRLTPSVLGPVGQPSWWTDAHLGVDGAAHKRVLIVPTAGTAQPVAPQPARTVRDHRWEGAIAGSVAVGLTMLVMGAQVCGESDLRGERCARTVVVFTLMGGTVGAVVGGLVGSTIPKRPAPDN